MITLSATTRSAWTRPSEQLGDLNTSELLMQPLVQRPLVVLLRRAVSRVPLLDEIQHGGKRVPDVELDLVEESHHSPRCGGVSHSILPERCSACGQGRPSDEVEVGWTVTTPPIDR